MPVVIFVLVLRIAVFSVTVLHDDRIVLVAEQRPDASEEDSFQWMSRVVQVGARPAPVQPAVARPAPGGPQPAPPARSGWQPSRFQSGQLPCAHHGVGLSLLASRPGPTAPAQPRHSTQGALKLARHGAETVVGRHGAPREGPCVLAL